MIPKESDGERFEDSLSRVCRLGGGTATDNADSDSDVEVVADYFGVNLRCPVSCFLMLSSRLLLRIVGEVEMFSLIFFRVYGTAYREYNTFR